jgi:hypothetical protein
VKRLGPELKMPKLKGGEMKVPPFLSDLYFDLRERRLLPLVALILVAIVAAPILLAGSDTPEPVPPPAATASGSPAAQSLTVVKAEPGLRNYKKRLGHRSPTNPFKQRFTAPELQGAQLNSVAATPTGGGSGSGEGGGSESTVTAPSSGGSELPSSGGGGGGSSGGSTLQPGEIQLYSFAIDVKFSHTEPTPAGELKMGEPVTREKVKRGTTLPGEKAPVLTFLGVDNEAETALMLVTPEAIGLLGDNKCLAGTSTCELLALEPEVPEIIEVGENGARYKFELLKVEPIKGPKIKDPQGAQAEPPNG